MVLFTCLLALAMASVHVAAGRLRSLETRRRSRWLSVAGGVSAAYVFVRLYRAPAGRVATEQPY